MIRLQGLGRPSPHLPHHRWTTVVCQFGVSAALHVMALATLVAVVARSAPPAASTQPTPAIVAPDQTPHMVFIARDERLLSGGGGGGGNRQAGPIRHAEAVGRDKTTVRVSPPALSSRSVAESAPAPSLLLDAKPLASGTREQVGLLVGGVSFGISTGPGSGGGAGEGIGTGVGPGRGPGIGPGAGGGIGGGVYRPGGSVTSPRVITTVRPTYTNDALQRRIQGTVELELVVKRDGRPADIRIVRSLDPGGLDEQAVTAAGQWRFEPGRLAGAPVDVVVTVMLDFWIR